MSRSSGTKFVGPCPYCGKRYLFTNYMSREKLALMDKAGRRLTDTHLIACYRKMTDWCIARRAVQVDADRRRIAGEGSEGENKETGVKNKGLTNYTRESKISDMKDGHSFITIRVRRRTLRNAKLIGAVTGMSMADYLDALVLADAQTRGKNVYSVMEKRDDR